jgi:hypothetical protein
MIKKIFLMTIFLDLCFSAIAQNVSTSTLIDTNEKYIINLIEINGNYFAPIGWSRNGYFAYGCQFRYYSGGYSEITVRITNTITDGFIADFRTWDTTYSNYSTYSTFKEFWDNNKQRITQLLESHSIISFQNMQFESIDNLNSLYGLEIDIREELYEFNGYNEIQKNIIIRNSNDKQKTITKLGSIYTYENVLFYIKSPFEDRIVFYIETIQVDDAPSAGHKSYEFIGCHLTIGFE